MQNLHKKNDAAHVETSNIPFLVQIWLVYPIIKTTSKIFKHPALWENTLMQKNLLKTKTESWKKVSQMDLGTDVRRYGRIKEGQTGPPFLQDPFRQSRESKNNRNIYFIRNSKADWNYVNFFSIHGVHYGRVGGKWGVEYSLGWVVPIFF